MENQKSPNQDNYSDAPNAAPQFPGTKRRRRIAGGPVLSSDQLEADKLTIIDPEAEVTEEDLLLLGDPDLDQDEGVDEIIGNDQYLDDADFDDDPLNEESGRRAGSGSDLDVPDDELDNAGSGMQQEDEENDFFGHHDDDDEAPEKVDTNIF
jgi:hypothetical protein